MFTVYKITNNVNGKVYIGATTKTLEKRYFRGFSKTSCNKTLNSDAAKYGEENFSIEVLLECDSREQMNQVETDFILMHDSTNPEIGYNTYTGGNKGRILGDKHKERMLSNFKGKRHSGFSHLWSDPEVKKEHCRKLSEARKRYLKNNSISEETKRKLSESGKKYWSEAKYDKRRKRTLPDIGN